MAAHAQLAAPPLSCRQGRKLPARSAGLKAAAQASSCARLGTCSWLCAPPTFTSPTFAAAFTLCCRKLARSTCAACAKRANMLSHSLLPL